MRTRSAYVGDRGRRLVAAAVVDDDHFGAVADRSPAANRGSASSAATCSTRARSARCRARSGVSDVADRPDHFERAIEIVGGVARHSRAATARSPRTTRHRPLARGASSASMRARSDGRFTFRRREPRGKRQQCRVEMLESSPPARRDADCRCRCRSVSLMRRSTAGCMSR